MNFPLKTTNGYYSRDIFIFDNSGESKYCKLKKLNSTKYNLTNQRWNKL